jgi:hypothetical protein
MSMFASTKVRVWGTRDCWSLAPDGRAQADGVETVVLLEIQGDNHDGYHLVMSPAGFFTADSHHKTLDDALDAGSDLFGVARDHWVTK